MTTTTEQPRITKELEISLKLVPIPYSVSPEAWERNYTKTLTTEEEPCACCGKGIKDPKFYINSAFGGSMFIPIDGAEYADTWEMPVGNTCVKKVNPEYIFKYES